MKILVLGAAGMVGRRPDIGVDHDIGRGRFIFEREEEDPLGGCGPLTDKHDASHAGTPPLGQGSGHSDLGHAAGREPLPLKGEWMLDE